MTPAMITPFFSSPKKNTLMFSQPAPGRAAGQPGREGRAVELGRELLARFMQAQSAVSAGRLAGKVGREIEVLVAGAGANGRNGRGENHA